MPGVARVGDAISHGGSITTGSAKVFADGFPVARIGDSANCSVHGAVVITDGSSNVFAEGLGVARIGDSLSCGATIVSGSVKVFAD